MSSIWVSWVRRLQSIAQNGRNYSKNEFDLQRYQQVEDVAAEIAAKYSDGELETIKGMFRGESGPATPKIDVRAAVISENKILLVKERGDGWTFAWWMGRSWRVPQRSGCARNKGRIRV